MNIEKKIKTAEVAASLVKWITDKVSESGTKGVVFGMSGGIDSSVVSVICSKAFPDNCLGINMPCHSNVLDERHARDVAENFHIPIYTVNLDQAYDVLVEEFNLHLESDENHNMQLGLANIKSRLRMLTLYYFANVFNYLVVGSSNRSELSIGYFTKHGDSGVDIMPIANLVKEQVRDLAVYLGIPQHIIEKPPTAGLWEGQTDEKEMGLTYRQLDDYLIYGRAEGDVKQLIETMMKKSLHKRETPLKPEEKI